MFNRFAGDARRIVIVAHEEARSLGSARIDPRHLILAVLLAGEPPSRKVLEEAGFTVDQVRDEIRADATAGDEGPGPRSEGRDDDGAVLSAEDADALRAIGIDLDAVQESIAEQFGPDALVGDQPDAEDRPTTDDEAEGEPAGDREAAGDRETAGDREAAGDPGAGANAADDRRGPDAGCGHGGPHRGHPHGHRHGGPRGRRGGGRGGRDRGGWDGPGEWPGGRGFGPGGPGGRGFGPGGPGGPGGRGRGGRRRGRIGFDDEARRALSLAVRGALAGSSRELTGAYLLLGVLDGATGPTLGLIETRSTPDALAERLRERMGHAA